MPRISNHAHEKSETTSGAWNRLKILQSKSLEPEFPTCQKQNSRRRSNCVSMALLFSLCNLVGSNSIHESIASNFKKLRNLNSLFSKERIVANHDQDMTRAEKNNFVLFGKLCRTKSFISRQRIDIAYLKSSCVILVLIPCAAEMPRALACSGEPFP